MGVGLTCNKKKCIPIHYHTIVVVVVVCKNKYSEVAFPTGRDSATFRDKGTEVPSLSRDKGTTGQAQNLATGRDGIF